jgi:hypothetical protein
MNKFVVAEALEPVLEKRVRVPTAVMWNRLEGRPRRTDFTRALRAEARDPLWLLTRQWQMGEFAGEDAGSPVLAKVAWRTNSVTALHAEGGAPRSYDRDALPLEAVIEARPVDLIRAGRKHNVDVRLALGRRWEKLLHKSSHGDLVGAFRGLYRFDAPEETEFTVTAHAGTWQMLAAVAARSVDGGELWSHLEEPGARASDGLGLDESLEAEIDTLGDTFLSWARQLYVQAPIETWQPRHLEYRAELSAPHGDKAAALRAPEYRGGHLDWFDFDAVPPSAADTPEQTALGVQSFIPTSIQFDGMPNTRHWAFEEGATNFGAIDPDTTDIAKLLLIEFGLVFANDWFLIPVDLSVGSLTKIAGLAVSNVFGERFWIEPAVSGAGSTHGWQMFRLTSKGAPDPRLFLPPTTPAGLESAPVESVSFVRDEVSNMVWGIEMVVQLADGASRRGREVALELHAKYQAAVSSGAASPSAAAPANAATVKYVLMRSVPEHWIPFIPVHIPGDNREIQLQRAAMPRLLEGEEGVTPAKIAPRTAILREGLDEAQARSYFVAEEEVERTGTQLETRWQRCRWLNGRVITWLSIQRTTGRGEVSSGLAFDILAPVAAKS